MRRRRYADEDRHCADSSANNCLCRSSGRHRKRKRKRPTSSNGNGGVFGSLPLSIAAIILLTSSSFRGGGLGLGLSSSLLAAAQDTAAEIGQCTVPSRIAPTSSLSEPYQIGVLAIRGFESAYAEFNATFSTYLTLTAGRRFDPPISFQLRPLNFISLFDDVKSSPPAVDFIYVNPSAYSCIESEFSAHSLVSQISNRRVGGQSYDLTKFGGVVATLSDRDDINTIQDIRGKIVAAASISGLGSGQMQFRELEKAGMSYINAPRQLVFTSNQGRVVNGVLDGEFDVGFVRTDQIERTRDASGELVDPARLKIINPQPNLEIDGVPFPFESSTPLYPEWNLASLAHIGDDVASEVQSAMRALEAHAAVGYGILGCYDACDGGGEEEEDGGGGGGGDAAAPTGLEECKTSCRDTADLTAGGRCDTTVELALAAAEAKTNGKYTGWRSTLSYMELRNMQEETNFIRLNETSGQRQCIRSSNIYDAIVCPPGHFRRTEAEVLAGCGMTGLPCEEGFQCLCRPCVQGFDVDVFPVHDDGSTMHGAGTSRLLADSEDEDDGPVGCAKMSVCGTTEQTKTIRFRAIDNKKRPDLELVVLVNAGQSETREIIATPVGARANAIEQTYTYEFEVAESRVGVVVLEVLANGEQIPESPLRLEVTQRNCAADYNDPSSVAQNDGTCTCEANSVEMGGRCVSYAVLLPAIIIPILAVLAVAVFIYIKRKHKAADSVWHVKENELIFDDLPEVIGRGTFGLVLLAEYRGTQVAVKRVIPPKLSKQNSSNKAIVSPTAMAKRYSFLPSRASMASAPRQSSLDPSLENIEEEDSIAEDLSAHGDTRQDQRGSSSGSLPRRGSMSGEFSGLRRLSNSMPRRMSRRMSSGDNIPDEERRRRSAYDAFNDDPESRNVGVLSKRNSDSGRRKSDFGRRNSDFGRRNSDFGRRHSDLDRRHSDIDRRNSDIGKRNSSGFDSSDGLESGVFGGLSGHASQSGAFESSQRNASGGRGRRSGSATDTGKGSGNWILRRLGLQSTDEYGKLKADFVVEMRHLSKLRHPCITTVMGAVIEKGVEPMLVMEFMDMGSLHDILHNESFPLDGDLLLPILRDIAQGVRFLHAAQPQVVHGDLKAHNVLVDGKFRAKVADFGLSAKKTIGATGTPLWMAPELLRGDSKNTAASDVYSFGIILYEVYSRKDPFEGENVAAVLRDVADPKINKRPPVPPACPVKVVAIMTDCLAGDPRKRPAVEEIDLRLKRLSVENVEPGEMHLSHQARKHLNARRGEDLISKMFPKHIADQLRQGRKPEPESKEIVTVFFSDIVGFTDISSKLQAEKVSDMLDRLYLKFDALADKHDIFKIETIGDAFIGVTNLVKNQNDHAKRIAEFSIDAVAAASNTPISLDDPALGNVVIRAGFHSGPVIASVVGSRLPKYTILGDTVNCASRMESNSLPGRIQCTERTARILAKECPSIPISPRGDIHIKGKGDMACFWVNEVPTGSRRHLLPQTSQPRLKQPSPPQSPSEPSEEAPATTSATTTVTSSNTTAAAQEDLDLEIGKSHVAAAQDYSEAEFQLDK